MYNSPTVINELVARAVYCNLLTLPMSIAQVSPVFLVSNENLLSELVEPKQWHFLSTANI